MESFAKCTQPCDNKDAQMNRHMVPNTTIVLIISVHIYQHGDDTETHILYITATENKRNVRVTACQGQIQECRQTSVVVVE